MNPRLFAVLSIVCASVFAFAQAQPFAPNYPDEPFVIESMSSKHVFQKDGTGTRELTARVLVHSDAGVQAFGVLEFPYEKDREEVNVEYVRVRKPNGTVVVTPASDVQDIDTAVSRVAPMYSDERVKHVLVKTLSVGDTLEYRAVTRVVKAAAPGQFWTSYSFFRDGIILDEQVEFDVPRDQYVNVKSTDVQPVVSEDGDQKIYRWKTRNLRRKTDEEKAKESKQEPPPPSIQLTTFHNWDEIAQWYAGLERDRVQPTDIVRAKALELTKDAKTDTDKLRAIYHYVSSDFRYIGLEFGVGRYQPHAAAEVFANQYGDCKDKQTLLAAMAKAVGIEVDAVLLNSARKVDESVPSPAQIDHVIGVAQVAGKSYWLDTTPQVAPFGMLLYGLRDKRVLVVSDKPEWRKTPAASPVENVVAFESTGELKSDGVFEGKMVRTFSGDTAIALRAALRVSGQPAWKDLVQKISYNTGFQGLVSDVIITGTDELSKPIDIKYSYVRKDYSEWVDRKRMTPPMPPLDMFTINEQGQDKSTDPIVLGGPFHEILRAVTTLPEGFTPEMIPEVNLHTDFGDYRSTYKLEGRQLTAIRDLKINQRELPRSRLEEFNKFAKAVVDDESNMFVGKTSGDTQVAQAASDIGKMLGVPSEDAATLFQRGREQLQTRNVTAAMADFQKVADADPKYPGVWTAIGFCYLVQNKPDDGLKALRQEVQNHPDNSDANRALYSALLALHHPAEANEALAAYVKVAPTDIKAARSLAGVQQRQGKYQEAAQTLEAVLKSSAPTPALLTQLGSAYARAGDKAKALATFQQAVSLKPDDAETLNDAAYEMADAKLDLTDSEQWAVKAVKLIEAETSSVTLGDLTMEDVRRMNALSAYWDTLGWIYFRENDLPEAERYLKLAWNLAQSPTIGQHLAQVYANQGKKLEAAKLFADSMGAIPVNAFPNAADPDDRKERIERLVNRATAARLLQSAGEDLSLARTFHLPNFVHGVGTGEFFLLLGPGNEVDTKFISGESALRKNAKALQTALTGKLQAARPGKEPAKIVRRAIVICHTSGNYCELVLMTPDSVTSLQ